MSELCPLGDITALHTGSSQLVPCDMLGMPADNLLWPDQLFMRLENLFARRCNEPNGYGCRNNRVEGCISGNGDQQAGRYWREGYVHIAHVVNVGQPDGCVVSSRVKQQS